MTQPLLSVENLAVHIGGLVAIADASFAVPEGQVVSLIGPNGAGKTTAFNVITGYMRPTAGRIGFAGQDITGLSPDRVAGRGLVRSFQRTSVFAGCTVLENALMALHRRGEAGLLDALLRLPRHRREEARLREEARAMLDFVGLAARADTLAEVLAYGEQRRLGIALAAIATPRLLLLDEPAAGLNHSEKQQLLELCRRIRDLGTAVVLIEHDMGMVMELSERIVVMNFGKEIAEGSPAQVKANPAVIEAYLGKEEEVS
jgi:branched-chain amino acid transport system ATP-binding protein